MTLYGYGEGGEKILQKITIEDKLKNYGVEKDLYASMSGKENGPEDPGPAQTDIHENPALEEGNGGEQPQEATPLGEEDIPLDDVPAQHGKAYGLAKEGLSRAAGVAGICARNTIKAARYSIRTLIPIALVAGAGLSAVPDIGRIWDKESAWAHMRASNFDAARSATYNFSHTGNDLEYFFDVTVDLLNKGRQGTLQNYARFHYPELKSRNLELRKIALDGIPTTSLEKLVASDGTEFYVVGNNNMDDPHFTIFNNEGGAPIHAPGASKGRLVPSSDNKRLFWSIDGRIQSLELEAVLGSAHYQPVVRTIRDMKRDISELTPYDVDGDGIEELFFTRDDGQIFGIGQKNGRIKFSEIIELNEAETMRVRHAPIITELDVNGEDIMVPINNALHVWDEIGTYRRHRFPQSIKEVLVGDVDRQDYPYVFIVTDEGFLSENSLFIAVGRSLPTVTPRYDRWDFLGDVSDGTYALEDLWDDGGVELLYSYNEGGYRAIAPRFSSLDLENMGGWIPGRNGEHLTDKIVTKPVLLRERNEIVIGANDGDVYGISIYGDVNWRLGLDGEVLSSGIRYESLNGEDFLTVATKAGLYLIGDGWPDAVSEIDYAGIDYWSSINRRYR